MMVKESESILMEKKWKQAQSRREEAHLQLEMVGLLSEDIIQTEIGGTQPCR